MIDRKNCILFIAPQILSTNHGGGIRVLEEARALSQFTDKTVAIYTYKLGKDFDEMLPPSVAIERTWYTPTMFSAGPNPHRFHMDIQLAVRTIQSIKLKTAVTHVHIHEGVPIAKVLTVFNRSPMIFDVQGSTVEELITSGSLDNEGTFTAILRHIECLIYKMPFALITSNPIISNQLTSIHGIKKEAVYTVLDAVDTNVFKPVDNNAKFLIELKRILGIPQNNKVVIYAGSFSNLQGTYILLKAIPNVIKTLPKTTFLLIGGKWNPVYLASMRSLAKELDIEKSVIFLPAADYFRELPSYLNIADVAVAPKLASPQSHGKLAVYMAAGLPTVVFEIPINRVFLGSLGIYSKEISPEALAESILLALDKYSNDETFKEDLRARACASFSLKRLADDLNNVYTSVLQTK